MSEGLILLGALALGLERWTELWMNAIKTWGGRAEEGDNLKRFGYRVVAIAISVGSGIVTAVVFGLDVRDYLPGATIENGEILAGIIAGLGAAPAHEVIRYIEEKKHKAEAEKKVAGETVQKPVGQLSRASGTPLTPEEREAMVAAINEINTNTSAPAFVGAVDEARTSDPALQQLRADPRAYFASKGVEFPKEVRIEFSEPHSFRVCYFRYYGYMEVWQCFTVSM